ncbi:hypothetical protein GCM10009760_46150 [Kitasatospora kazusensis]|uniref:Secreted protein n=1 Tax=Kitasatospora kazusensis TaxID=407974 RepID=A0ABP5LP58_9ACTN
MPPIRFGSPQATVALMTLWPGLFALAAQSEDPPGAEDLADGFAEGFDEDFADAVPVGAVLAADIGAAEF